MKEVFRSSDAGRVGLYQSILADAGIGPFVRHSSTQQTPVAGLITAIFPRPEFWPALCVVNDADYPEAMTPLRSVNEPAAAARADWQCAGCGETVARQFRHLLELPATTGRSAGRLS